MFGRGRARVSRCRFSERGTITRVRAYAHPGMARGQGGSLFLAGRALSSPTPCRFIPPLSDGPLLPLSFHRFRMPQRGMNVVPGG